MNFFIQENFIEKLMESLSIEMTVIFDIISVTLE